MTDPHFAGLLCLTVHVNEHFPCFNLLHAKNGSKRLCWYLKDEVRVLGVQNVFLELNISLVARKRCVQVLKINQ